MTWIDSLYYWAQHGLGIAPGVLDWLFNVLGEVGETNPWMVSLWNLFESIVGMFLALAPMAPMIFMFMAISAVLLALDRFSPDPIIEFVLMLYNFGLGIIATIAAVVEMVFPF